MHQLEEVGRILVIAESLARLGLGAFIKTLNIPWHKRFGALKNPPQKLPPEEVCKELEHLGGAFVKLGQLLSLRPDLVPEEYCEAFRSLQDHVEPLPYRTVEKLLKERYKKLHHVFDHVEPMPLGSASIAQVHKAKLTGGGLVVIKLQRPHIRQRFEADIHIMKRLAKRLDHHYKGSKFSFSTIVNEFEQYTQEELDFTQEAGSLSEFAHHFKDHESVKIPKVYPELSSKTILVTQYFRAKKLGNIDPKKAHVRATFLARKLLDVYVESVFSMGLFHADMHPGNILVLPRGKFALIDFGIVGCLSKSMRRHGLDLFYGITLSDPDMVSRALLKIGPAHPLTDHGSFRKTIRAHLAAARNAQRRTPITTLFHRLLDTAVQHRLAIPSDAVLLGKASVTLESTVRHLDPHIDMTAYLRPHIEDILYDQKKANFTKKELVRRAVHLRDSVEDVTASLGTIIERVKSGSLKIDIADEEIKDLSRNIDNSSNRVSYAVLIAAFVVSGALLIGVGPSIVGVSVVSLVLFALGGLFLLLLLISIIRES